MNTNQNLDQINVILTTLNGVAIDDHVDAFHPLFKRLTLIREIGIVGEHVVGFDSTCTMSYSINSLYIGPDGMVHISRDQVGIASQGDYNFINHRTVISIK